MEDELNLYSIDRLSCPLLDHNHCRRVYIVCSSVISMDDAKTMAFFLISDV